MGTYPAPPAPCHPLCWALVECGRAVGGEHRTADSTGTECPRPATRALPQSPGLVCHRDFPRESLRVMWPALGSFMEDSSPCKAPLSSCVPRALRPRGLAVSPWLVSQSSVPGALCRLNLAGQLVAAVRTRPSPAGCLGRSVLCWTAWRSRIQSLLLYHPERASGRSPAPEHPSPMCRKSSEIDVGLGLRQGPEPRGVQARCPPAWVGGGEAVEGPQLRTGPRRLLEQVDSGPPWMAVGRHPVAPGRGASDGCGCPHQFTLLPELLVTGSRPGPDHPLFLGDKPTSWVGGHSLRRHRGC